MLNVSNISFGYTSVEVLKNISFTAKKGEYVAIIGESGCGKSTLLEIIYGLLAIEKGAVFWNEEKLLGPDFYLIPGEPFMKYLSQDFDLMPFTSVAENIGKFLPNRFPKEKKARTDELMEVVDMTPFANTKVKDLSGGQKQRVALARVLAKEPELLLLDEPFSHIDNFRKNHLRRKLFAYLKSKEIGCLVATHDTTDALSFADRILVLKDGKMIAMDTPHKLYNFPKSEYIASFFGDVNEVFKRDFSSEKNTDQKCILYPNEIEIVENSETKATVEASYFKGDFYLIETKLKEQKVFVNSNVFIENGTIVFLKVSENLLNNRTL